MAEHHLKSCHQNDVSFLLDLLAFLLYCLSTDWRLNKRILLFYMDETLNGWKKFATLLPNNWLAETPQALAPRRLGRQSAERERISEIN
ncbi:hypothetical protein ACIQY5_05865 [Peribacillus frigoritolerans]|uniref:hypothetical protein n=1 Tax=Peribacillus frigoritolerans TaxID=450367 RepID=UPI003806A704